MWLGSSKGEGKVLKGQGIVSRVEGRQGLVGQRGVGRRWRRSLEGSRGCNNQEMELVRGQAERGKKENTGKKGKHYKHKGKKVVSRPRLMIVIPRQCCVMLCNIRHSTGQNSYLR